MFERSELRILDRVYFEYAYFMSKADELIVFVQNSQNTARAENISSATIRGHEVSWSATALQHVRLFGNYTYQHTEDTSNTFSRGNKLPGRPELHQGPNSSSPRANSSMNWTILRRIFWIVPMCSWLTAVSSTT